MRTNRTGATGRLALAGLILVAVMAGGCDYLEKKRIERTLDDRKNALLGGNVKAYFDFFAPEYNYGWVPMDQARARITERLRKKPLPVVGYGKRQVDLNGARAVVTERFTLEDRVEGRTKSYEDVQHLVLQRTASGWQCVSGSKVAALLGGVIEEEHEIDRVMLQREASLTSEDVAGYMSLIAPDYQHKGEGPEEVRQKILQIFRVYDDIEFRSFDRKISFLGAAAEVRQKFSMNAVKMGKSMSLSGEEKFELVKTDEGWKFTKGMK